MERIITIEKAAAIAAAARQKGLCVVTTSGCYDLLHPGHVATFEWAKARGDMLIVGVNSDASVRDNKVPGRPIISERQRAEMIAALRCVDYVFIFDGRSPIPWMREIKPSIQVKGMGSEISSAFTPEEDAIKAGGGKVVLSPKIEGWSTTDVINEILRRYGKK